MTQLTAAEIQANRTQGEWEVIPKNNGHSYSSDIKSGRIYIANVSDKDNAAAIVSAVSGTYGMGYDPLQMEALYKCLDDLRSKSYPLSDGNYRCEFIPELFNMIEKALAAAKITPLSP